MNVRRRSNRLAIPLLAALLTLPVGGALQKPISSWTGWVLCPDHHSRLVVLVSRDLTRAPRTSGATRANCMCATPGTEEDCRWRRTSCDAIPISSASTYAVLLGTSYGIAALLLLPVGLLWRRRSVRTGVTPTAVPQNWEEEARRLHGMGETIQAIKLVRQRTGLGLREAKELVESWGLRG